MNQHKFTFRHVTGHSAYDHYAAEIIARAQANNPATKRAAESALSQAWKESRPQGGIGPRIDVLDRR